MTDINCVVLMGKVVGEAELKTLPTGTICLNFTIGVANSYVRGDSQKDELYFFPCTLFGKFAERIAPHMTKGKGIVVQGALRQEKWEKDGKKNSKVSILASSVRFSTPPEKTEPTNDYEEECPL